LLPRLPAAAGAIDARSQNYLYQPLLWKNHPKSFIMVPGLSEDEIDDLLFFARTGDKEEFNTLKDELCERQKIGTAGLLELARDEMSGNGALHMAAANGHNGKTHSLIVYCFRRNGK
jgi:hypothetical protein